MNDKLLEKYFNYAKKLSKHSNHYKYRLGCLVVSGRKIIGEGWNLQKTHPKSPHPFHHIHAEFMAILGIDEELLKNSDVIIYRENKNCLVGLAKPCPICHKMLKDVGIKRVFYTDKNGYGILIL